MSSGFITESEAADIRKKRQEEWERVRKENDPLERPEEPYDSRSLYEKLQEQKQKKDLEYEEAHKLKNMIKGLDDDEIEFLDLVDRTKLAADRKINIEEEQELNDYRNRVATLQEKSLDQKLQSEINMRKRKAASNSRNSQMKLLKGVVVKKDNAKHKHGDLSDNSEYKTDDAPDENKTSRKRKYSEIDEDGTDQTEVATELSAVTGSSGNVKNKDDLRNKQHGMINKEKNNVKKSVDVLCAEENTTKDVESESSINLAYTDSGLTCIGILPGMGCYNDSSSDVSSDSDQEEIAAKIQIDMLGRKVMKKEKDS